MRDQTFASVIGQVFAHRTARMFAGTAWLAGARTVAGRAEGTGRVLRLAQTGAATTATRDALVIVYAPVACPQSELERVLQVTAH